MSPTARRSRNMAAATALALLVVGAVAGHDDHFPFGPFRMYATATKTTGAVSVPVLEGVTPDGEEIRFFIRDFGLRRAELEGQLRLAPNHEDLLADLAETYRRFHPDGPRLAELRLVRVSRHIEGGKVVDRTERIVTSYRLDGDR